MYRILLYCIMLHDIIKSPLSFRGDAKGGLSLALRTCIVYYARRHQTCHFRKRATLGLQTDLRTGSISRDIVNFPSELCSRKSGTEVTCLVPPDHETRGAGTNTNIIPALISTQLVNKHN